MNLGDNNAVFGSALEDKHVRDLVAARLNGTASSQQVAELSEIIVSRPEVRDYFVAHSVLVGQLTTYAGTAENDASPAVIAAGAGGSWMAGRVGIMAFVIIAFGLVSYLFLDFDRTPLTSNPSAQEIVGEIQQTSNGNQVKSLVAGETVSIEDGDCKVTLDNGVKLVVQSPASFVVENQMRCRLWNGRLTADVSPQAIGFRVITKHADIVDQGTRFGVAVEPDSGTNIAVFEGQVDVASHDQPLQVGRAVSISSDGTLSRLQLVTPATFESSENSAGRVESTIRSVRDNIRSVEELGFYRIVPRGFGEDRPAYVDRIHQWNGVDSKGLPKELLQADYVMPFNDDKLKEDFEITLSLARKANVFVLFDDRNAIPNWLKQDFADTGLNVGQDEGRVPWNETLLETAIGSGNSIDNEFSVWKSRVPMSGEVTLQGPFNGVDARQHSDWQKNKRSMYGVLAVPVQNNELGNKPST